MDEQSAHHSLDATRIELGESSSDHFSCIRSFPNLAAALTFPLRLMRRPVTTRRRRTCLRRKVRAAPAAPTHHRSGPTRPEPRPADADAPPSPRPSRARTAALPSTHGSPQKDGREHTAATPPNCRRARPTRPPSPAPDRQTASQPKTPQRSHQTRRRGRLLSHGATPLFSCQTEKSDRVGGSRRRFPSRQPAPRPSPFIHACLRFVVFSVSREEVRCEPVALRLPCRLARPRSGSGRRFGLGAVCVLAAAVRAVMRSPGGGS